MLLSYLLKRILCIGSNKKKWNKTEGDRKNLEKAEKENNTNESDLSENERLDLNSLKPFEFESKTNIWVINNSSSDDQKQPLVVAS